MKPKYKVGDRFELTADAIENYGEKGKGIFEVTHVARSREEHPGFDEGAGSPLYDFKRVINNRAEDDMQFSVYEWEMEPV